MKKIFITLSLMILSAISLFSQTCEWAESISGKKINGNCNDAVNCSAIDKDGHIFFTGIYYSDTINFNNGIFLTNNGSVDCFLVKYDSKNTCLWAEKIEGSSNVYAFDIIIDNNGYINVLGIATPGIINFNNEKSLTQLNNNFCFIAKYDSFGICQWAKEIAEAEDEVKYNIDIDNSGNIYFAGSFHSSSISFNNDISLKNSGYYDAFIAKYNSLGLCQWAEKISGNDYDQQINIKINNIGNIYIAGIFQSSVLDFNNGISISNSGYHDVFIAKYNSSGICQWAEKIGGNNMDYANNITVDNFDNVYIAGQFASDQLNFNNGKFLKNFGSTDAFITKYDSLGICQWAENIGGNSLDYAPYIASDYSGNIYLTGFYFSSPISFNNNISLKSSGASDVFVAKYNTSGICIWAEKIGGMSYEYVNCISTDNNKNIYIAGSSSSSSVLFNNGITLNNVLCFYLAKYKDNATSVSDKTIQNNISIYPNPANDYIEIQPSEGWQPSEGSNILIFNTLGENVLSVEQTPSSVHRINISNLAPGMYFLKIGNRVEKFVKM